MKPASHLQDVVTETPYNKLKYVLAQETRETGILGALEACEAAIPLPSADAKLAELAQHRFGDLLQPQALIIKGSEVNFKRFCSPADEKTTGDILKGVQGISA